MTYQTGTALHIDDLLSKLSTFAATDGWTVNKTVAGGGDGHSSELYLENGECVVSMEAVVTSGNNQYHGVLQAKDKEDLRMYGSTSFDGGAAVNAQPNTSGYTETTWLLPNMILYKFFSDPTVPYIYIAIEVIPGEFRHFGFGVMEKIGAFDGGMFLFGTHHDQPSSGIDNPNSSTHKWAFCKSQSNSASGPDNIRANVDGAMWKNMRTGAVASQKALGVYGDIATPGALLDSFLNQRASDRLGTPNSFNGVSPLFSGPVIIDRASLYSIIGHFVDVRFLNIKDITPNTIQVLGSDNWHVFPVSTKKLPTLRDDLPNSGYYGIAFKEIP